ncbi:MAG: GHKL domain-containing protein, partial [Candidatus Omnitrophica bacterium]|nr:GHKL domain-containing protein [Candidatus Omnitrophota bacterium]
YQRVLLRAAIGMVTEHNLKKLSNLIVFILKKTIRLDFAAIYVVNNKEKTCNLEVRRGKDAFDADFQESLPKEHPFLIYLENNRDPFLTDEIPDGTKNSFSALLKAKAVIPSFSGDKLLGFVLLGQKMNNRSYSEDDLNVFKILSRQAALAIENCFFFEETKSSQERMFAAEKLASIGGMADGLAHQIKNRLNQFSLAAGELKAEIEDFTAKNKERVESETGLSKTFNYLKEITSSLLENVKRTDGVIKGILDFAKTEKRDNFASSFPIKEITELSLNLLKVKHEVSTIPLSVKYEGEGMVFANKAQLTEVIYNLLDNAYEATKEKSLMLKDQEDYSPLLELNLTYNHNRQIIRISDNGIGIRDEDKEKMFAPFFTTKTSYKSGSGIGVYVVKRIIEENQKGKIRFESEYGKGTVFIIELPLKNA